MSIRQCRKDLKVYKARATSPKSWVKEYFYTIEIHRNCYIKNEVGLADREIAMRMAKRVAKELNIELEWV